jgi:RNA polymerase sigma-32 factor
VVAIALRYRNYPIAMSDLVSEGTLGLMVALGKFDCSRQTRFVTYASFWIRAYILDLVIRSWHSGKHGTGPFRSKVFFKLRREHARLSSRFGNAPEGIRYMAWQMGLTEEGLRDMLHQIELGDVSIDQLLCDDRPATIKDMLADKNPDPEQEVCSRREALFTRKIVEEALAVLDERERHVVRVRLMADEPETLATVGETLGVSRERARQLEVRARKKLGAHLARSMQSHSTAVA